MEVLGPLKEFSKKYESTSTYAISFVLGLSLVLLYHVLLAHLRHAGSWMNKGETFVVSLRTDFISFLDDPEQFFLRACATALGGRQKDL